MARWSLKSALATAFLVAGRLASAEEEPCNKCDPADQRVTVLVIEMGPKPDDVVPTTTIALPAAETIVTNTAEEKPPVQPPVHPENTTHIFTPCPAPGLDLTDPANLVPVKNAALYYEAVEQEKPGSINMTLAFNNPAVILEHVEAIQNVTCSKDKLAVSFSTREAYDEAVQDWEIDEPFVLITRAQDNCSGDFERGFYLVADIVADVKNLVITTTAEKKELSDIAGECEMFFTSLPAATLTKRLTLDPKVSVGFSESLPDNTVLFTDGQYISIVAEEAYFSSNLTFSGYLKYNFWGFKLEQLYFDLDTNFKTAATLNAQVQAAFQKTLNYAPDALAWNVVDVPGIVQLGPGIAFGIRMDVNASAAVGIRTGLEIGIPHGNVHIDLLKGAKTETSGWEPKYESFANITQRADLGLDVIADVTVQLAFKLLGGLVDLTSGITASPGFANQFKLRGKQDLSAGGVGNQTHTGIGLPLDDVACASTNGVQFISKFLFSVKGFATKWFSKELYAVTVPIVDKCYSWGKA